MMKTISIVIPCRNEEKYIEPCLTSLLQNHSNNYEIEIVVVDGMSDDATRAIVTSFQKNFFNVKLLDNPKLYTPIALNIGVQHATGDFIMIASAHSAFENNYIDILYTELERLDADGVGGYMQTKTYNDNNKTRAIEKVLACKFGVGNATFRVGAKEIQSVDTVPFGLYKKQVFKELGGYDERLIRNHDIEFSKRMIASGKKIFLIPDAICTYYARETFGDIAQNNFRNGLWNILTVKITKDLSSLSLRHFIPLLFLFSLIVPAVCSVFFYPLIFISIASLCAYLILLCFMCVRISIINNRNFFYLFCSFIVLHFSYASGSLVGILKKPHNE